MREKLQVYRRNGVQEYIVWQVSDQIIDWFRLRDGKYLKLQPDTENTIKSEIFPGLWLAINPLLDGNLAQVLQTLQQGLKTSEHRDFVAQLNNQIKKNIY